MSKHGHCHGFVLSAGRTGTVWLTHTLGSMFPEVEFSHEPWPSRTELMLGNLRNEWGVGQGILRKLLLVSRQRRWAKGLPGRRYVEVNPMLCAAADLLVELFDGLNVVHLVRDPRTWSASIVNFKASGYRRFIVDYIPFATPYPSPRPQGWRRLNSLDKALWRWRFCNEQILRARGKCQRYALIRYEDLFSPELTLREKSMRVLLNTLQLPANRQNCWINVDKRINATRRSNQAWVIPSEEEVRSICGDLLLDFGYEHAASEARPGVD